jgi:hypothetical protein
MVMSRDQNAGRSDNIKIDNRSFVRLEEFKYLGTTINNQNYMQEEMERRSKSGNDCYHSVESFVLQFAIKKF